MAFGVSVRREFERSFYFGLLAILGKTAETAIESAVFTTKLPCPKLFTFLPWQKLVQINFNCT